MTTDFNELYMEALQGVGLDTRTAVEISNNYIDLLEARILELEETESGEDEFEYDEYDEFGEDDRTNFANLKVPREVYIKLLETLHNQYGGGGLVANISEAADIISAAYGITKLEAMINLTEWVNSPQLAHNQTSPVQTVEDYLDEQGLSSVVCDCPFCRITTF